MFGNYKEIIYYCKKNQTIHEKIGALSMYLLDLKRENEELKLSFTDSSDITYINSDDGYFSDFDDYFMYFIATIESYYEHIRTNPHEYNYEDFSERYRWFTYKGLRVSERDFFIIDSIYYDPDNYDKLCAGNYKEMPERSSFTFMDDYLYCSGVIRVLREIMIKNFNFQRYWLYLMEEVNEKLKAISENYESHLKEANGCNRQIRKVIVGPYGIAE